MNLIEAIKSGRRFKRQSEISWMSDDQLYNYVKADIIADDWEIEEKLVTITSTQFYEAWRAAVKKSHESSFYLADILAKELGL